MSGRIGIQALVMVLASLAAIAQVAANHPQFDAASVKMTPRDAVRLSGKGMPALNSVREDSGRIDYEMIGLRNLILMAWQLETYQVVWPKWIADLGRSSNIDRYSIVATMPADTSKSQVKLMLQGLLAERFKLAAHREMRSVPVYALVISKRGELLRRVPDPPDDLYIGPMASRAGWHIKGNYTLSRFAGFFSGELDRPLLDMTGLEGYYQIDLVWDRPIQTGRGSGPGTPGDDATVPSASTPDGGNEASLFSALEHQLGLGVEKRVLPTEMLVIDHVERIPTQN